MIITVQKLLALQVRLILDPIAAVPGAVLQRRLDGPDLLRGAESLAVIVVHPATLTMAVVVAIPRTAKRTSDGCSEWSGHWLLSFKCRKQNCPKFEVLNFNCFQIFFINICDAFIDYLERVDDDVDSRVNGKKKMIYPDKNIHPERRRS